MPSEKTRPNYYVYALRVEGEKFPFYIGKGRYECRPRQHVTEAMRGVDSWKCRKIRKVLREGGQVTFDKLFESPREDAAYAAEKMAIAFYGRRDIHSGILVNQNAGGLGCPSHLTSAETREKMRQKALARPPFSEDVRARISANNKGKHSKPMAEEVKAKISAAQKGIKKDPEYVRHMAEAKRGKPAHPDTIEALRKANKGRPLTSEHRAKIAAAHTGKKQAPHTQEWKDKVFAKLRGRKDSPEVRARKKAGAIERRRREREFKLSQLAIALLAA